MSLKCEMCGTDTDVEPVYCCSGKDCSCGGNYANDELIVCHQCRECLEYLDNLKDQFDYEYSILKRAKYKKEPDVTFDIGMVDL